MSKKATMTNEEYWAYYKNKDTRSGIINYIVSYPAYMLAGLFTVLHIRYYFMLLFGL